MAVTVASLRAVLDLDKRGFDKGMGAANAMLTGIATGAATRGIHLLEQGVSALVGTMVDGVTKAADLESQLDAIGAISGATEQEVAGLKKVVSDLGLDPKLKVSAFEAAQAVEELAAGGVALEDIMNGAAKGTVALANATGADFAQAATIAADAMSIFGIEAKNLNKVVDGVAAVAVSSKFDVNDYAFALAQAGGVAKASGVEFDDFNTAITAIAPLFASGSDAGTSFKTMLQRLVGQTAKAKGVMSDLGIITEEQGNRFFDAQGNLQSMAEIAGVLDEAFSGLSEQQRNQAMTTIFGTDAMRAAIGLMETGGAGFTKIQEQMSQTSGADAAAQRMTNLKGTLEILQGVVESLQISFGDKLIPKLTELGTKATEWASTKGPAMVDSLANLATAIITFGEQVTPTIFQELGEAFGGIGTNLDKLNVTFEKTQKLFGVADDKISKISVSAMVFNTIIGALMQPIDLLNVVLGFMIDNVNTALEEMNALKGAVIGMADGTETLISRLYELGAALADMVIPDWLTPGSPTPFETGLWGIVSALDAMPNMGNVFGGQALAGGMSPVATGSGGTSHTTNINLGGQSMSFSGADQGEQAIIAMAQFLRRQLAGAG